MSEKAEKSWEEVATVLMATTLPASDIEKKVGGAAGWTRKAISLKRGIERSLRDAFERGKVAALESGHVEMAIQVCRALKKLNDEFSNCGVCGEADNGEDHAEDCPVPLAIEVIERAEGK